MDKEVIITQLKGLSQKSSKRSIASKLRDVFEHIESAMMAGVPRSEIVEILSKQGIEVSENALSSNLCRIRKERDGSKKTSNNSAKQKLLTTEPVESNQLDDEAPLPISHNPADLDKIFNSKVDLDGLIKAAKRIKK